MCIFLRVVELVDSPVCVTPPEKGNVSDCKPNEERVMLLKCIAEG